jgi:hypothetical protein
VGVGAGGRALDMPREVGAAHLAQDTDVEVIREADEVVQRPVLRHVGTGHEMRLDEGDVPRLEDVLQRPVRERKRDTRLLGLSGRVVLQPERERRDGRLGAVVVVERQLLVVVGAIEVVAGDH